MPEIEFVIERLILKIGNQLSNRRIQDVKAHDLTAFQSETLLFFASHEGARILDLKEHLNISHQAARNLVERVRQKGLVEPRVSTTDARAKSVSLTEKGRILVEELQMHGTEVGIGILSGLSDEEKKTLLWYLERIQENL